MTCWIGLSGDVFFAQSAFLALLSSILVKVGTNYHCTKCLIVESTCYNAYLCGFFFLLSILTAKNIKQSLQESECCV